MSRPLAVLFTLDYEVFGDGSGDSNILQISTTNSLLNALRLIDARMTVFVEFGQLRFFREHRQQHCFAQNLERIEQQLTELVNSGHDVQLHIHPTWYGATLAASGKPQLQISQFDISTVEESLAVEWLCEGKDYLETLLRSANPDYRCFAYRAGALSASNEARYLRILERSGISVDSSVAPGATLQSVYGAFDYRSISRLVPYKVTDSLRQNVPAGKIWEFPILTETGLTSTRRYINSYGLKNRKISNSYYPNKVTDAGKGRLAAAVEKLFRSYAMADFNYVDGTGLVSMLNKAAQTDKDHECGPFVLLGHSKFSFNNEELFFLDRGLKSLGYEPRYQTLTEAVAAL